jgi:hypothetical protein
MLEDENELKLSSAGHAELRADLLGRLASMQPVGSAYHERLTAHVLARCALR